MHLALLSRPPPPKKKQSRELSRERHGKRRVHTAATLFHEEHVECLFVSSAPRYVSSNRTYDHPSPALSYDVHVCAPPRLD